MRRFDAIRIVAVMLKRTRIALAALAIVALGGLARSEYSPIRAIMGPNSSTIGNVACWGDLFGLSLTDCGGAGSTVGAVPTNAALKALAGGLYTSVVRTGYFADRDVPSAIYVWNAGASCTDDGGSCIQPNVGSGRWILGSTAQPVPVGFFGATCDGFGGGATDVTTALQKAINYAQGTGIAGGSIKMQGNCKVSNTLTITNSIAIYGDGLSVTNIWQTDLTKTTINFNPTLENQTVILKGFSIAYPAVTSGGAVAIQFGNVAHNTAGGIISEIGIFEATAGVNFQNAINVTFSKNYIQTYWFYGISIDYPLLPDSGQGNFVDNWIINNGTAYAFSDAIRWFSGGGINISGNKLLTSNIALNISQTAQTSEFQFTNNLIFGPTTAGIQMAKTGAIEMTEMLISHNVFDSSTRALLIPASGGKWINNLTFVNNQISSAQNASQNQITVNDTFGFFIANNLIKCNGTCTTGRAIFTAATSDKGVINQSVDSEVGAWGAADAILSTNTTVAATKGGQTKVCTVLPTVLNGVVTAC